jgi:hypothetical protein
MARNKIARSRPVEVRKGSQVGPDYPDDKRVNPWDDEISHQYGEDGDKAICSENSTLFEGVGMPINKALYDDLWEGK